MRVASLFLSVAFISGCSGLLDYIPPNIWDARSTNNKVIEKPREATWNTHAPEIDNEAVAGYHKRAEQGDASAQNSLGEMYKNGQGVSQDYKKAVAWYRKAAEQGDANAQNNLGVMYKNGYGVPQDYKEAIAWYRRAAEQANASAQNDLGGMYKNGQGVPPSRVVAYALYNLSAANDPSSANIATGHRTYLAGNMTAQEIDAAQNLTREMARHNNLLTALDNYIRNPSVQEQFKQ